MSEHHPDMDLIMALAAGDLPPDEAARIETGLDAEARAELAAQRTALEALALLPRPSLSADEQALLRTVVRAELYLERPPRPVTPRRRRPARSPLVRALPALAAFASLIVVLAIALDFGVGDDDALGSAPAFDAPAVTTAAPATAAMPETTAAPAPQTTVIVATSEAAYELEAAQLSADEAKAMMEEAEEAMVEATTTTGAALAIESTDTTAARATTGGASIAFQLSASRAADFVTLVSEAIAEGFADTFPTSELVERAAWQGLACGDVAASEAGPDGTVYFMAYGLVDGEEAEVYFIVRDEQVEEAPALDALEPEDIRLFSRPGCGPIEFSTP